MTEWNEQVTKTFQNVINDRPAEIETLYCASNNCYSVNLFVSHDDAYICVNDFLIHCRMAIATEDMNNDSEIELDENEKPMHTIIQLYWKEGESMRNKVKIQQQTRQQINEKKVELPYFKVIIISSQDKLIFARYQLYTLIPWFNISVILSDIDEDIIETFATKHNFEVIRITPLSDPILCLKLLKTMSLFSKCPVSRHGLSQISLYSIDCVKKMLLYYNYSRTQIYEQLDYARIAEASKNPLFWTEV
ncbi:unnamed protein product [Didymodactylos carnosus]|uniref:Uncharacterized protein n=1 Tax=Didymodactylos carnosus TaxID=1234261 RepID=A0A813UZY0_9BILA|nr:unnamed protein product [Didymodactylos carnosus]CAF3617470.1 unnamed protein product [Didymodactylos carnosus]